MITISWYELGVVCLIGYFATLGWALFRAIFKWRK